MDPLLERFNRLIKSMFVDDKIDIDFSENYEFDNSGNDYADAWQELNDFLDSPDPGSSTYSKTNDTKPNYPTPPEVLKKDYKNLEVPFGTEFEVIKKSYKQLLIKHHPDKNSFSSEALKISTEKTKTLNISFQRIKTWELAKSTN